MDSVTHVLLGGAVGQCLLGKRIGAASFWLGALAATLPDFDVFIHTGDSVRDHVLHRHFMHSLLIIPMLAAFAVLPFVASKRLRPSWLAMYGSALLACATHSPLDLLTSYGTMILWPFTNRRYALDIVAAVDLFYTLPLLLGVIIAARRRSPIPARIALAISTLYLGLAAIQHQRAVNAQNAILVARHHEAAANARVLPQLGATLNYRSIYHFDGRIYADAIRVTPFSPPRMKPGSNIEEAHLPADASELAARQFEGFRDFTGDFIGPVPGNAQLLGDMRYTGTPEGFAAIWGIVKENDEFCWRQAVRPRIILKLARDLVHPGGYETLESAAARPTH